MRRLDKAPRLGGVLMSMMKIMKQAAQSSAPRLRLPGIIIAFRPTLIGSSYDATSERYHARQTVSGHDTAVVQVVAIETQPLVLRL